MIDKVLIAQEKCYQISVDVSKNRMYLTIVERWLDIHDLDTFQASWREGVEQLTTNFTICADFRKMAVVTKELESIFSIMQLYSVEKGVLHAAEIAAINDIANLQVQQISGRSVLPFTRFKTVEEAEQFLDRLQA